MRKKTIKHICTATYRAIFIFLPLLFGLVFAFTKLPLGTIDYSDSDDDTLSSRFESVFKASAYDPLSKVGLQNTFLYKGVSKLFGLLGFEYDYVNIFVPTTGFSESQTISGLHTSFVQGERFEGDVDWFESFDWASASGTTNKQITLLRADNAGTFGVVYLSRQGTTNYFYSINTQLRYVRPDGIYWGSAVVLYSIVWDSTLQDYVLSSSSIAPENIYFYMPYNISEIVDSRVNDYLSPILLSSQSFGSNMYIEYIGLYITYIVFLFLFELFVRVLIWLPKFALTLLEKPLNSVGGVEND